MTAAEQASRVRDFFSVPGMYDRLIEHQGEKEVQLGKSLDLASALKWESPKKVKFKHFGWSGGTTDFHPCEDAQNSDEKPVVIEFKRVGLKNANGKERKDECNCVLAIAQALVQAVQTHAVRALVVLIDGGRASKRQWHDEEKKVVETFTRNPHNIELAVVRIRVDRGTQQIECEVFTRESASAP